VGTVLNLSRRIGEIFESSELDEKRAILNFLLQNPTVNGKTLGFTLRSPFNLVLELAGLKTMLSERDLNIPLFFNKEYMQQMAQRFELIKLMRAMEDKEQGALELS